MTRRSKSYECVCGKSHKSRSTVWLHKKAAQVGDTSEKLNTSLEHEVSNTLHVPVKNPFMAAGKAGEKAGKAIRAKVSKNSKPQIPSSNDIDRRVTKINLKPEFDTMVEEIGKPKAADVKAGEPNYRCAFCGKEYYFPTRPKACPLCGEKYQ